MTRHPLQQARIFKKILQRPPPLLLAADERGQQFRVVLEKNFFHKKFEKQGYDFPAANTREQKN
jgi:hypothetical protein